MDWKFGYFSRLLRSWRLPAYCLLVLATHWVVEELVETGSFRGLLILLSLFLSPLVISTFARKRKLWWGASVNGAYLLVSYSAFILERGRLEALEDSMLFLLVLAFGLVCGACAGGFQERLSCRFNQTR